MAEETPSPPLPLGAPGGGVRFSLIHPGEAQGFLRRTLTLIGVVVFVACVTLGACDVVEQRAFFEQNAAAKRLDRIEERLQALDKLEIEKRFERLDTLLSQKSSGK